MLKPMFSIGFNSTHTVVSVSGELKSKKEVNQFIDMLAILTNNWKPDDRKSK